MDKIDKPNKKKEEVKEEVKKKQHAVKSCGTTKVVVPNKDSEFEYIIHSESKPLIRSIQTALLSDTNFRAVLQPPDKTTTSTYSVGLILLSKLRPMGPAAISPGSSSSEKIRVSPTCETLRERIESRPEIRCIEHETLLSIMKTLYSQVYALDASHHMSLPYFSLDDVIIFDDKVALFINDTKLFDLNPGPNSTPNDEMRHDSDSDSDSADRATYSGIPTIDITRTIGREDGSFFPPELSGGKILSLPYTVNSRCAYYSFGMMVAYCSTLNPKLIMKYTTIQKLLLIKDGILDPIKGTKLYWFIRRCCASNPVDRRMLYV
jgi:hypothetical protein